MASLLGTARRLARAEACRGRSRRRAPGGGRGTGTPGRVRAVWRRASVGFIPGRGPASGRPGGLADLAAPGRPGRGQDAGRRRARPLLGRVGARPSHRPGRRRGRRLPRYDDPGTERPAGDRSPVGSAEVRALETAIDLAQRRNRDLPVGRPARAGPGPPVRPALVRRALRLAVPEPDVPGDPAGPPGARGRDPRYLRERAVPRVRPGASRRRAGRVRAGPAGAIGHRLRALAARRRPVLPGPRARRRGARLDPANPQRLRRLLRGRPDLGRQRAGDPRAVVCGLWRADRSGLSRPGQHGQERGGPGGSRRVRPGARRADHRVLAIASGAGGSGPGGDPFGGTASRARPVDPPAAAGSWPRASSPTDVPNPGARSSTRRPIPSIPPRRRSTPSAARYARSSPKDALPRPPAPACCRTTS